MADVTISSLPMGTPSGNALLPFSQGNNTLSINVSAIFQNTTSNIGINTTEPSAQLDVNGVVKTTYLSVSNAGVTSSHRNDRIVFNASKFYVVNEASYLGVNLANGSTSWAAQSDERDKDIIEPITSAAEKVSSLRTVIGKYKKDNVGVRRSFLIAQDVQAVLPEAVSVNDEDGKLSLRYTEVIPLLVAAIKELKQRIVDLESKG